MANNNESTMKWKVDISDLKKAMQDAQKSIKLATAEFKTATAGMDSWSKSSEGLEAKIEQLNKVLPEQKNILSSLEQQYEETAKVMGENSKSAADLKLKIENQKAAIAKTESSIDKYNNQLVDMKKKQAESESASGKLTKEIEDQESQLKDLKTAYVNATLEYGKNSDEAKDLAKQIEDLSGELKDNKTELNNAEKAADELDQSFEDLDPEDTANGFTVLKGALANLAAEGISKCVEAVKDFAKESVQVGIGFDDSMSQLSAVSGATGDDLEALRNKAKEMGSSTKFTASEAADAFNYMAMAGWKTEDMLSGIDGILNLAAASGSDLATTSDIVTDALTAMGYSAKDAGRLADVMAAAASNANTNVEMMGGTFKYAAPVAGALGYSMEDTALAIGLMANSGIKAEMAGTSLRSIMTRLATDAGASSKQLGALGTLTEELGVQFYNTDGTTRDLSDVLIEAREAWAGLSEEQQTSYGKQIAGQEALSGWLALMNAAPEDVEKLTGAIENCDGAASDMASTMMDNLGGDLTTLDSQFEGIKLTLYEQVEPALRSGIDAVSAFGDKLLEFINWLNSGSAGAEAFKAVVIGLAVAFGVLATALAIQGIINGVTKAIAFLNTTMLANPIMLVVAAIAALVAGFLYLWNTSEEFRNFWIGLWEAITEWVSQAVEDIGEFFSNLWQGIKEVWETVSTWFDTNVIQPVVGFFKGLWEDVSGFFTDLWNDIKGIWTAVSTWFDENVIQPITGFFKDLWDGIVYWFHTIIDPWIEIAKRAFMLFKTDVIDPLVQFFTDLWNGIKDAANAAWEFIKGVWTAVSTWFDENIIQPVKNFFTGLWEGISGAASTAWETIKNVWSVVTNWFNEKIILPVKNFFTDMWDGLKNGAKNAWQGIKNVFGSVKNWFKEKFSAAWQAVKDVFSTGGKIFSGIKEGIENVFKTVVNKIISGINTVVAFPFNAINGFLDTLRNLSILGIQPFSWIGSIAVPQIPELARGGVLKKGQIGLLEGSGAEAVVPLEDNKKWIAAVVKGMVEEMNLDNLNGTVAGQLALMTGKTGSVEAVTQNLTFNQTINSPKAVDRLTLYRETNNLLFSAKVGLANV